MPEIVIQLLVLIVGVATGFVDSTVGSGGLISIPFLIFLGLPPPVAIATDRLGMVGQTLAALFKFGKAKKIIWRYVPFFTALALLGSFLGANILLNLDPQVFPKVIGVILFASLSLLFLKRNLGLERIITTSGRKALGFFLYFLLTIFAGFFGAGAGPLFGYTYMFFFGLTIIETKATDIIPWVALALSSLLIFLSRGLVDYQRGVFLLAGMALGGYLGAHLTLKVGDLWVRRLFVAVVLVSGVKLLFF
jgi:uncharacterized membrane protein YfcA